MAVLNTLNTRFKLLFALLLVVALPVFIWAVATQRIELRKRAATSEPPIVCWNRLQVQGDTVPENIAWPDGCKGNPPGSGVCTMATSPLTATEKYDLQQWISAGRPWLTGCELYYPTPTPSPQPECESCNSNVDCNPGLICGYVPTPTSNCPYGSSGPCSVPVGGSYHVCVKPEGTSQCPVRWISQPPTPYITSSACTPLPSCAYSPEPNGAMCALPQYPPGGGVWCPRPTPPPPPGCQYRPTACTESYPPHCSYTLDCSPTKPPQPPLGCYYQQVQCFQAPCYPILVCPQTYCPGPNGSACSVPKCRQPVYNAEGSVNLMYQSRCTSQSGSCQNNQCIIGLPPNPMTCNYSINPPNICPVGYSCRYTDVPTTYLRTDAQGGAGGAVAETAAISVDTATTGYWRGRNGICVPDYPGCSPEGSSCSIGGDCPPQPSCAPGVPCPKMAAWCKRAAGICTKGQCLPLPNPPYISNGDIMTNVNPWSVWLVATNLTTSTMNARLYDTDGSQWGSLIPVKIGAVDNYQYAGFRLPTNTPPSNCNKGKTCTITADLVPANGNPSNRYTLTLPSSESITCERNVPKVTIDPATQEGNPGTTLNYTASVTNNDSMGCDTSKFDLSVDVNSGFTSTIQANTIDIQPQQTVKVPFTVTSPNPNPNAATVSITLGFTVHNPNGSYSPTTANTIYTYVQPVETTVKFRFKFAGVTGDITPALNALKETITVIFNPRSGDSFKLDPDLVLRYAGNGVYEADYTIKKPLPPDTEFTLLVKGPKHGAVRFCTQQGQTAPCPYGTYMKATGTTFDFTGRPLPAGDLNGDKVINQADVKFVTDLLSKPSNTRKPEDIQRYDVNYDGLVDIRDLLLITQSLSVKQDE